MEFTLQGGTDGGSMVLFDPSALPIDFDQKYEDDPIPQLEKLTRTGHLYWFSMDGDGSYTLGIYVQDHLPDKLKPFAKTIESCDHFHVPGGRLFFTGIEYTFQTDDSRLRKYPHMGESVKLPAGLYRADFFEFEYPEGFHEEFLRHRLSTAEFRAFELMNSLAPIGCIGLLVTLGALAALKWTMWATFVLLFGLVIIALPLTLSRLPAYRKASAAYEEISKEFPGNGVLLRMSLPEASKS